MVMDRITPLLFVLSLVFHPFVVRIKIGGQF